jgi:hypothetical protein
MFALPRNTNSIAHPAKNFKSTNVYLPDFHLNRLQNGATFTEHSIELPSIHREGKVFF